MSGLLFTVSLEGRPYTETADLRVALVWAQAIDYGQDMHGREARAEIALGGGQS